MRQWNWPVSGARQVSLLHIYLNSPHHQGQVNSPRYFLNRQGKGTGISLLESQRLPTPSYPLPEHGRSGGMLLSPGSEGPPALPEDRVGLSGNGNKTGKCPSEIQESGMFLGERGDVL